MYTKTFLDSEDKNFKRSNKMELLFKFSELTIFQVCRQEQAGLILLHILTILMYLDIFRVT